MSRNLTIGEVVQMVQFAADREDEIAIGVYEMENFDEWDESPADWITDNRYTIFDIRLFVSVYFVADELKRLKSSHLNIHDRSLSGDLNQTFYVFASNEIRDRVYQHYLKQ